MWNNPRARKVVWSLVFFVALVGGLVMSHREAYYAGREAQRKEAAVPVNAMVTASYFSNLSAAIRGLRAADKDPHAFDPVDIQFYRYIARSSADSLEWEIIPAIRRDEEAERQREKSRTVFDEEQRIERMRQMVREALTLDTALAGRIPG
jgi:DNA-binding FadR family transcriptional regulator